MRNQEEDKPGTADSTIPENATGTSIVLDGTTRYSPSF
jgi:hypothetical protein